MEDLIEIVMRANGYNSYEDYNNEDIREKFRQMLMEDKNNG